MLQDRNIKHIINISIRTATNNFFIVDKLFGLFD